MDFDRTFTIKKRRLYDGNRRTSVYWSNLSPYMSPTEYWLRKVVGLNGFIECNRPYKITGKQLGDLSDICDSLLYIVNNKPLFCPEYLLTNVAKEILPIDPVINPHGLYDKSYVKCLSETRDMIIRLFERSNCQTFYYEQE